MQIAMTVGATKIQIMQESTLATMTIDHSHTEKDSQPQADAPDCKP